MCKGYQIKNLTRPRPALIKKRFKVELVWLAILLTFSCKQDGKKDIVVPAAKINLKSCCSAKLPSRFGKIARSPDTVFPKTTKTAVIIK